jgi:enoyl-CoA hydratase
MEVTSFRFICIDLEVINDKRPSYRFSFSSQPVKELLSKPNKSEQSQRRFAMPVHVEKKGPVTTVILSRPEVRNAVDRDTAEALAQAFREFDEDDDAMAGVLYGEGGAFCAGADLKAVASGKHNRTEPEGDGPMGPSRMLLSKPVVAAISGYAVAGGLELALWCDLRVMEDDAVMGVFCRRWGIPLIDGGTVRLPRLIGLSRALDLILTGRPVGAAEALSIGLANRVVPKGTARQAAESLARELAQFPQVCLRGDRRSAYEQFDLRMDEALANEFNHGLAALKEETTAGAARFSSGAGRHGSFEGFENE